MDDTKKALLSIDIDTAALTQNVANAKASVSTLTDQLNLLKASGKDSGEAFDKVTEQLKKATEAANKSKDAFKDYTKSLSDNTKAAADLAKQHTGLQTDTDKTKKSLGEYAKGLVEAAEKTNPVAKSIGETVKQFNTFRDIAGQVSDAFGNYKKQVSAALDNSKTFNSGAGAGTKAMEALKISSEVATGGFEGLGKAITGTGIGLFIVILASAIEYFKKFTPLVEFCDRATAGLSGAFDALSNIVGTLLQPMLKIFTEPKQAIIDLGKFLVDNVINRFKAIGVIINSILHPSLKGLADGFIQLNTGITNATDKFTAFGKTISNAAAQTAKLKGAQQELDRQIQSSTIKNAEDAARIAQLRIMAQTTDLVKRREYLREIQAIQKAETETHKHQVEEQVRITIGKVTATHGLNQVEINDLHNLTSEKIEALRISKHLNAEEVKSLQEAVKQLADLHRENAENTLKHHTENLNLQKSYKASKKAIDAEDAKEKKEREDAIANQEVRDQKELYDLQQEAEIKAASANFDKVFSLKKDQLKQDKEYELQQTDLTATQIKVITEKYKQQTNELITTYDENKKKAKEAAQNKIYDAQLEQDKLEIDRNQNNLSLKLKAELKFLDDKYQADKFNAGKDAELNAKLYAEYAKAKKEKDAEYLESTKKTSESELTLLDKKLQHYQSHFAKLSGLFAKNTQASKAAFAAQKALAVAEIAINTEKQVSSIFTATREAVAQDQKLGPIAGTIKSAIDIAIGAAEVVGTIANGVKQVSTINSTNAQGFARGGLYQSDGYGGYLTGPGNGTSDSINARLSNGESIINARSTEMFAPILSAINQAGGGRAFNATNTSNGYALGGLFNGSNTLNDGYSELANTRALNDMAKTLAANMPRQILVVEDVQASLQNKALLQSLSNF